MNLIKKDRLNIAVQNNYEYIFEVAENGIYLIEIIASAKSWWQNIKSLKSFFQDDDLAVKAVAFWNKEVFSQDNPPNELLDPNLVKAIVFQESRTGYDKNNNGNVNVMQVGNSGDPSLNVLNNQTENPEYEMINGKLWKVDYEDKAKVENIYDSIYWGVRWLYHRAQYIGDDGARCWFPWKDAVNRYGPGTQEYTDNIWNIYEQGLDKRVNPAIKLRIILFLFLLPAIVFAFTDNIPNDKSIKTAIFNTIENSYEKEYVQNIQVDYYKKNSPLFLTIIETQKDWSERFEIGNYANGKISWIEINKKPTEQSILSARFLNLEGFDNPFVEVYGQTHAGHGFFYLYEIENNKAKLLLENPAVDINSDTRWTPENKEKYGYENCGEIFTDGNLNSNYEDLNGDGISDIILSGTKEIICDSEISDSGYTEIKVAKNVIKKVFLLDDSAKSFVSE
ncbi:MAG TPA: hypothetical protein DCS28_00880 [Candidatus Moranbacteria bacterium]|nr:hypothetical protein [Candidatus Moranbacteria bacterium]HAT74582.1 hypothetical protein [Candidatus Moranbacteria bacterium]